MILLQIRMFTAFNTVANSRKHSTPDSRSLSEGGKFDAPSVAGCYTTDGKGIVCNYLPAFHCFLVHDRAGNGPLLVGLVRADCLPWRPGSFGACRLADWVRQVQARVARGRVCNHGDRVDRFFLRKSVYMVLSARA